MGSSNRTLLAKLGFADKDRTSPRHDLACAYIAQNEEVLKRVMQAALPAPLRCLAASAIPEHHVTKGEGKYSTTVGFVDVYATFSVGVPIEVREPVAPPVQEPEQQSLEEELRALQKAHPVYGRERWAATATQAEYAGLLQWQREQEAAISDRRNARWGRALHEYAERAKAAPRGELVVAAEFKAVIEVKIAPCSSGDLIRQLRVYNEHVPHRPERRGWGTPVVPTAWREYLASNDTPMLHDREKDYYYSTVQDTVAKLEKLPRCTIAALDFEIDAEYRGALRAAGVTPVRLGAGFERFLEERKKVDGGEEIPEV